MQAQIQNIKKVFDDGSLEYKLYLDVKVEVTKADIESGKGHFITESDKKVGKVLWDAISGNHINAKMR